jgi:SAM-dependent methyltransferase
MVFEDRDRAGSFGDDAAQYDRSRPGYPDELIAALVRDDPRVAVDVGCGTGIVADLLAGRGVDVVGVEPDERMASVARAKGLHVEVAKFEDWDAAGRLFDLLTSGQAWHWVDPEAGARKAAEVLAPGGRFAVFWNGLRHDRKVAEAFDLIYSRHAPHLLDESVALGTAKRTGVSDREAFEHGGSFRDLDTFRYEWERRYTSAQWIDELPTHSGHRVLARSVLDRILAEVGKALDERGGEIVVAYTTAGLSGRRG